MCNDAPVDDDHADDDHADAPATPEIARRLLSRRLSYIMLVRVILFTLILGGTVVLNLVWGTPEELGGPYVTFLFVFIAAIYVLNITYGLMLRWVTSLRGLAVAQLAGDLLTSAILVHFTGGADSAFVLFFLLTPIAAAVALSRKTAMLMAAAAALVFILVALLGFARWLPPLPGQVQLPYEITAGALGRSLLINSSAMVAVAVLAGYLAEQLRFAAERVEVQQAHIDDLATLNIDIIRCLTSGLITVSNEGRVIAINRAAGEILGLPHSQAVGRQLGSFCPELAAAANDPAGERRIEVEIQRGRDTHLLGTSVSPLTDHLNRIRGRIINFQDLTQIRRMEQTVKRSEHLASLGRMAAAIAHEIRNPLASISGSLELLQAEEGARQDNPKLMEIALREIERLNQLITSFLDYARPAPPQLVLLDLGLELPMLAEGMTDLPPDGQTPEVVVETEPELWVRADRDRLRAILWNLVRNAWEAGERDQITIRATSGAQAHVVLEVVDHANGIPDSDLDHIFEPFFTTKEKGTGLGLATVHRMVQDNNGTIRVKSKLGEGTSFIVTLPRVDPNDES